MMTLLCEVFPAGVECGVGRLAGFPQLFISKSAKGFMDLAVLVCAYPRVAGLTDPDHPERFPVNEL